MKSSLAIVSSLLLAALLPVFAAATQRTVPSGTQFSGGLANARPMEFRLSNRGDCGYRMQLFDTVGAGVLDVTVLPGESRDIVTPSVRVRTAIIDAADEPGAIGAVVVVLPLVDRERILVPGPSAGFVCDGTTRAIYTCSDVIGCPIVGYRVGNAAGLCDLILTAQRAGGNPRSISIPPGESVEVRGRFAAIECRSAEMGPQTFAYNYTRNP